MPDTTTEITEFDQDTALPPKTAALSDRYARFLALDDFERAARWRLPRMIYGFVSGAVETGAARANARGGYDDLALVPCAMRDVSVRRQDVTLFGKRYSCPFGIPPLGGAAMVAYRGDLALADAAQGAGIPMILSGAALTKLEDVRRGRPNAWFQAYLPGDHARIDPLIDRVASAGFETLVITGDTHLPGNRENNVRNGFSTPLRLSPRMAVDSVLHPLWLLGTIARTYRSGAPHFENLDADRGAPMMSGAAHRNFNDRDKLSWRHVEAIRRRWNGNLVAKGLLAAEDARIAREVGCDGIIVSSHGGRQLDHAIAPIRVLPEMVDAAGPMTVMIDGGIRRGTDVLKALSLGAKFVFVGRPMIYAAVVGGAPAVTHAIALLAAEIDRDLGLMGLTTLTDLNPSRVRRRAGLTSARATPRPMPSPLPSAGCLPQSGSRPVRPAR